MCVQEEITQGAVSLSVEAGKMTADLLQKALKKVLEEMVYQYAAPTKEETLAGLKEIVPVIRDAQTRAVVQSTINRLEQIPEPVCSKFIADTKAHFLEERDRSIRRRIAAAKEQTARAKQPRRKEATRKNPGLER